MKDNCHGCKWLDEIGKQGAWYWGAGYCAHVVHSKTQKARRARYADMERCELYEPGDFKTRHQKGDRT